MSRAARRGEMLDPLAMEIGIATFGDVSRDVTPAERIKQMLKEAKLADEVGLDLYAVGEHHRPDYMISAPTVLLAAVAAQTERIRLSSAVTVLSSEDPVRVWQQFAELDLISGGRAEIMAGRGSFTESFPLFGYDLKDYEPLFAEKLDLLLKLQDGGPIDWRGEHRPSLQADGIFPRPVQSPLPIWIAVGGTPASIERAARLRLPLALAIIGGRVSNFVGHVNLYRSAGGEGSPLAIQMHGFVAENATQANSRFAPEQIELMNRIGRERGWRPMTNQQYLAMTEGDGAIVVGSPEDVAEKIIGAHRLLGNSRFLMQMGVGSISHEHVMESIELLGTKVAPLVRAELAG